MNIEEVQFYGTFVAGAIGGVATAAIGEYLRQRKPASWSEYWNNINPGIALSEYVAGGLLIGYAFIESIDAIKNHLS